MTETIKKIGTHSGCFHTDEVLACTMLTKYTSEYKGAAITRTRDQAVIDQMDIVVDVKQQQQAWHEFLCKSLLENG